jgi:hypothetical protein
MMTSPLSGLCALAVMSGLLTVGGAAAARPMEGRLGVGLERTLAGASGLALRYFTGETLAVAVTLGVDVTVAADPEDPSASIISAGLATSFGPLWQVARSDHAHFAVGARLALGYRTLDALQRIDPAATASDLDVALELPLALELWLSDHFSVMCATGILIHLVPESGAQLDGDGPGSSAPPGGVGIGFGAGAITATLGAFYYF